jgi:hypothetical protein
VKRSDLEHIIRASGDLLGEEQVIVVGSQSILASYSEEVLPLEVARSLEADVLPLDDLSGTKADLIEGSLGEFSPFDEQFGVHVDGVSEDTSILPNGWRHRLIAFSNTNTNGVTGLCLERHDLCVAKLVANREKDREFVASLLRAQLVDADIILQRLDESGIRLERQQDIAAFIRASARTGHQG